MNGELYFDGASLGNPGTAAIGYVIQTADDTRTGSTVIGYATNNEAEYRALLSGLREALHHGITTLTILGDSELVLKQLTGSYSVNAENLQPLHREAMSLLAKFSGWETKHIDRAQNQRADDLANQALDSSG